MIKYFIKWFSKKPKEKSVFCATCQLNTHGRCMSLKSDYCGQEVNMNNWCEYAKARKVSE
jgi:hypothetical protein